MDQIEQSIATRFNVRAVLDIVRRPILLSGRVVPLVKQGVEGVEHQRFVFLLYRLTHNNSSSLRYFVDSVGIERDVLLDLRNIWIRVLIRPHRIDRFLSSSRNAVVIASPLYGQ